MVGIVVAESEIKSAGSVSKVKSFVEPRRGRGVPGDSRRVAGATIMSEHPTYANGKICYIDIPALDIAVSADFYQKTFGWNVRTRGDGSVAFDDGAGEVSGTWSVGRPAATPGFVIYIMVDSVEETADKVVENGGAIVQPIGMDAPEITARFSDPAGNIVGLYQEPS